MITFRVDNLKNMNACLKPFLDYLRSVDVDDDDVFDSRLVSCELISNVLKHLGETANFEGAVNGEDIVITVSSESTDGTLDRVLNFPMSFRRAAEALYHKSHMRPHICRRLFRQGKHTSPQRGGWRAG